MDSDKNLSLVIENKLYDLTKLSAWHPGGRKILEDFQDCDATDYFYSIHSEKARRMLKNLSAKDIPDEDKIPQSNYLKLMFTLERQGFFKQDYFVEGLQLLHIVSLIFIGIYYSETYPFIAAICFGLGTLVTGWISHQSEHQRNNIMRKVGSLFAPFAAGLSPHWWSFKHNLHHLSTNEIDHDGDIQLGPYLYLWTPKVKDDAWNRGIQHLYFTALYSVLMIKWQIDSMIWAIQHKKYQEVIQITIHWVWKISLVQWRVWVLGQLIAGTLLAWIVSASHQAEHKLSGKREFVAGEVPKSKYQIHDYIAHQVVTTRNIEIKNWFLNYLCGGMQYQIEHHIFPRLPLYKLSTTKSIIQKYCAENGLSYNEESFWQITKRNYQNIEKYAMAKAKI